MFDKLVNTLIRVPIGTMMGGAIAGQLVRTNKHRQATASTGYSPSPTYADTNEKQAEDIPPPRAERVELDRDTLEHLAKALQAGAETPLSPEACEAYAEILKEAAIAADVTKRMLEPGTKQTFSPPGTFSTYTYATFTTSSSTSPCP